MNRTQERVGGKQLSLHEEGVYMLRKGYYDVSDGLHGLSEASAILNDEKLRKDIYMIMEKIDDVHEHLNNKYKWD